MYIKSRNKIQILMHSYLKEEQLSHPDFQRELVVGQWDFQMRRDLDHHDHLEYPELDKNQ